MLVLAPIPQTPSSELLVTLWAERYTVDVSSLSKNPKFYGELMKAALPESRALTAAKLLKNVLERTTNQAKILTKSLYDYLPDFVDSYLGQRITQLACQIYQKLLEVYQKQSGIIVNPISRKRTTEGVAESFTLSLSAIPSIEKLANQLEPLFMKYQEQYIVAKDWRVLGFLTTMFNFINKLLINHLTPVEKILLCPYFKFVEEHIALPWQRVCAASAKHELGSAAFSLVEQMFPLTSEISSTVYCQLLQLFPTHCSLRGGLSQPSIAHSCIRDLDMFQAYLWLSILEESLRPIEQELVHLCVMVLPSVGVAWEMTDRGKKVLMNEIESNVQPQHKFLLLSYIQGLEEAFFKMRKQLGYKSDIIQRALHPAENRIVHIKAENNYQFMS
jgi:hypothetical protein